MLYTMRNIVGGGDCWAQTTNGTIQVVELAENDTTVVFSNVPANDNYGLMLWVDPDLMSDPTVNPPKQIGLPILGTPSDGVRTVTFNITTVTADQEGATCQLRIIK